MRRAGDPHDRRSNACALSSLPNVLDIPITLDSGLTLPSYARPGDAGVDLVSSIDVVIAPSGGRVLIPTGLAMALPDGYAGLVVPRSGLAANHGVTCLNTPGTIDSGYRGELKVLLVNTDPTDPYEVERGDRIAQLIIISVEQARFVAVPTLDESERSVGGFGHTGR